MAHPACTTTDFFPGFPRGTRPPSRLKHGLALSISLLLFGQGTSAAPLDPTTFASLGASPFGTPGTYTVDTSKDNPAPTLSGPGLSTPLTGVFHSPSNGTVANDEIAVFTFTGLDIPAGVTVQGVRNANSRPVALLSQGSVNVQGTVDVSGGNGARDGGRPVPGAGAAAGAAPSRWALSPP